MPLVQLYRPASGVPRDEVVNGRFPVSGRGNPTAVGETVANGDTQTRPAFFRPLRAAELVSRYSCSGTRAPTSRDALGQEQRALQHFPAAVAAQPPARRDDPVARHVRPGAAPHDISDGSCRPRPPRECCYVAVRRHPPRRDPPHDGQDTGGEFLVDPRHSATRGDSSRAAGPVNQQTRVAFRALTTAGPDARSGAVSRAQRAGRDPRPAAW